MSDIMNIYARSFMVAARMDAPAPGEVKALRRKRGWLSRRLGRAHRPAPRAGSDRP